MDTRPTLADFESHPHKISEVSEEVDREEVLRYMGYPPAYSPTSAIEGELNEWIERASAVVRAQASFQMLRVVELDRRSLRLRTPTDEIEFIGAIGEFLGVSQSVCVFVATSGWGIEELAGQLEAAGNSLAALIVNAVGAERAEAAEYAVIDFLGRIAAAEDLAATLPYSPGYCGMALTEQRKLFRLFDEIDTGVDLTDSCLMRPLKSVSGLIGFGPTADVQREGSPCERCELHNCSMRR